MPIAEACTPQTAYAGRGALDKQRGLAAGYRGAWDVIEDWAFVMLLMGFLIVLLATAWAAWLAWKGLRVGVVLGLALLPVEAVFWLGFALPIPWLFGLARGLLYPVAWKSLRQHRGRRLAG